MSAIVPSEASPLEIPSRKDYRQLSCVPGCDSGRIFLKIIESLEGLLELRDDVQALYELARTGRGHRTSIAPADEGPAEADDGILSRRYCPPSPASSKDKRLAKSLNKRADTVQQRISRLQAIQESISRARLHLKVVRGRVLAMKAKPTSPYISPTKTTEDWDESGETEVDSGSEILEWEPELTPDPQDLFYRAGIFERVEEKAESK
ncbi:hypothetical protein PQX77_005253 [Marasmius sp. AFHP31]|nr:hypothetical protein PQX77_005253 [Marasmius sp. AFHP31]